MIKNVYKNIKNKDEYLAIQKSQMESEKENCDKI